MSGRPAGVADDGRDPYAEAAKSAARLAELTRQDRHDVAVVLGSGWAPAAAAAGRALGAEMTEISVTDLGGFAEPTVPGHVGTVQSLVTRDLRVLMFLGRTHLYEGGPVRAIVQGVRTAIAAGCQVVVLTNAAGGIRGGYYVGQPVLIRDHLNLTGSCALARPRSSERYP